MFRISSQRLVATTVAALVAAHAVAQEDLTLPPRILDPGRPSQARLADPPESASELQEAASEPLQEIVVTGNDNPWRLPDLGSEWRARQAEQEPTGRIRVDVFPLWNPEAERPERDLLPLNSELRRVGFIEVFRVRFGRR